jgi:hypothetical protein
MFSVGPGSTHAGPWPAENFVQRQFSVIETGETRAIEVVHNDDNTTPARYGKATSSMPDTKLNLETL